MYLDEEKYNIVPTYNPVVAKDYDGFIGRDGAFYMVSKKYKHNPTHEDWAEWYLIETKKFINDYKTFKGWLDLCKYDEKQSILIHRHGYVYYGHSEKTSRGVIYVFPRDDKRNISTEQTKMLEDIMLLNNEIDALTTNDEGCSYADGELIKRFKFKDKLGGKLW